MDEMKTTTETVSAENAENAAGAAEQKTYTEAELLAIVQSEADKRVTQALKKQQAKFEKKMSEAEKLRSMDETQRAQYEFEQKLAEFEQQKREFAITQNKLEASKVMAQRGLPVNFVDYIVAEDADTMLENIKTFETAFKAAVADAVSQRISGGTPKGTATKQTGLTKDEFRKMSLAQQSELYKSNPELFKQFSGK